MEIESIIRPVRHYLIAVGDAGVNTLREVGCVPGYHCVLVNDRLKNTGKLPPGVVPCVVARDVIASKKKNLPKSVRQVFKPTSASLSVDSVTIICGAGFYSAQTIPRLVALFEQCSCSINVICYKPFSFEASYGYLKIKECSLSMLSRCGERVRWCWFPLVLSRQGSLVHYFSGVHHRVIGSLVAKRLSQTRAGFVKLKGAIIYD